MLSAADNTDVLDMDTLRFSINTVVLHEETDGSITYTLKYVRENLDATKDQVYEYKYNGKFDDFIAFLLQRFSIMRDKIGRGLKARHSRYYYSVVHLNVPLDPIEIRQALIVAGLNPETIHVVDLPFDTEKNVKVRPFEPYKLLPDRVFGVLNVEKTRYERSGGNTRHLLDCGYGMVPEYGTPAVMCKGTNLRDNIDAVKKLNRIPSSIRKPLSRLIAAAYSVIGRMKLKKSDRLPFEVPSYSEVYEFTDKYNTSSGITEHEVPKGVTPTETMYKINGTYVQTGAKKNGLKSDFNMQVASYTVEFFKKLFDHHCKDGKWDASFSWTRYAVHPKNETISLGDIIDWAGLREAVFDYREGDDTSLKTFEEALLKADAKVRLFWGDSMYSFILDIIESKPMTSSTTGSGICIGVSSVTGGLNYVFDTMSRDPDKVPDPADAENLSKLYEAFPEIFEEGFSVGDSDVSSFDMSQNALVLMVVRALPIIMWMETENMTLDMIIQMSAERSNSLIYKFATIALIQATLLVCGGVPSGNYVTSWIDSFVQLLYFRDYVETRIAEMPLELRKKAILCDLLFLFLVMVYGDDLMGTFPNYFKEYINWNDYFNFIQRNYGQNVKWSSCGEKELYSLVEFQSFNGVYVQTNFVPGIEFIKYYMAHVYVDGIYKGQFPFRPTEDIFSKLCYNSVEDLLGLLHLASSLAWLSVGNYEAFQILKMFYGLMRVKMRMVGLNPDSLLNEYSRLVQKGQVDIRSLPHSVRVLLMSKEVSCFPSLDHVQSRVNMCSPFLPMAPCRYNEKPYTVREPHPFVLYDFDDIVELVDGMDHILV
jgi:hypothetical protein